MAMQNEICVSIYTKNISKRLTYILDFFFKTIMNMDYHCFTNKDDFLRCCNTKINYSDEFIPKILQIIPAELLFETDIKKQNIEIENINDTPFFFRTSLSGEIQFDIFAASFWLLSRYEEYLPFTPDKFGRFPSTESLASKHGFLLRPVVDLYVKFLIQRISSHKCLFPLRRENPEFLPTFDIDNTFAYKYKGIVRNAGAFAKDFSKLNFANILKRIKVLCGLQKDPYDTYEFIQQNLKKHNSNSIFFILCGKYSNFDKNIPPEKAAFRNLILKLNKFSQIAIHPSFASTNDRRLIESEMFCLQSIINQAITTSRQHYLKIQLPETYRILAELNITSDYSMGYADSPGFRAGTCSPFQFFDLLNNEASNLTIYPFVLMDETFISYLKYSAQKTNLVISTLFDEVAAVNGVFIPIWHNHTFALQNHTWRNLFENTFQLANEKYFTNFQTEK